MIDTVENKFKGKCPLCQGQLIETSRKVDHVGGGQIVATDEIGFLNCENGDYRASIGDFEAAWSKHAAALNTALAILLTELKEANLKNN